MSRFRQLCVGLLVAIGCGPSTWDVVEPSAVATEQIERNPSCADESVVRVVATMPTRPWLQQVPGGPPLLDTGHAFRQLLNGRVLGEAMSPRPRVDQPITLAGTWPTAIFALTIVPPMGEVSEAPWARLRDGRWEVIQSWPASRVLPWTNGEHLVFFAPQMMQARPTPRVLRGSALEPAFALDESLFPFDLDAEPGRAVAVGGCTEALTPCAQRLVDGELRPVEALPVDAECRVNAAIAHLDGDTLVAAGQCLGHPDVAFLSVFADGRWESVAVPEELAIFRDLAIGGDGALWAIGSPGGANATLYRLEQRSLVPVPLPTNCGASTPRQVAADRLGSAYVVAEGSNDWQLLLAPGVDAAIHGYRFDACSDGALRFLPTASPSQLDEASIQSLTGAIHGVPEVQSVGFGVCCTDETPTPRCLRVYTERRADAPLVRAVLTNVAATGLVAPSIGFVGPAPNIEEL